MIRILKLSREYYGLEFEGLEDGLEEIKDCLSEGNPVLLVEDLEDVVMFGIEPRDIIMADRGEAEEEYK